MANREHPLRRFLESGEDTVAEDGIRRRIADCLEAGRTEKAAELTAVLTTKRSTRIAKWTAYLDRKDRERGPGR